MKTISLEMNKLLDLVYNLVDASDGVNGDLETIIGELVDHVESMVDFNDDIWRSWK